MNDINNHLLSGQEPVEQKFSGSDNYSAFFT